MNKNITKEDLKSFIHKPRWFHAPSPNNPDRCQFSVYAHNRAGNFHQCQKKPVEFFDGIGFCKTHLKKVKKHFGMIESTKTRFAATFDRVPVLVQLGVSEETESTIDIVSVKRLIGSDYTFYEGSMRKDSGSTRRYSFFNDKNDAIEYLMGEAANYVDFCGREYVKSKEIYDDLTRMWNS